MVVDVTLDAGTRVPGTALSGTVVLPDAARRTWHLDELRWDATARVMTSGVTEIELKAGPHSVVRLVFYIEPEVAGPVPRVTPVLAFTSDIPEFNGGAAFASSKALSGSIRLHAVPTGPSPGPDAASFTLDFPEQATITGTYLVAAPAPGKGGLRKKGWFTTRRPGSP